MFWFKQQKSLIQMLPTKFMNFFVQERQAAYYNNRVRSFKLAIQQRT